MPEDSNRPRRPALRADLAALIDAAGGTGATSRAELADATAAVVVNAGRERADVEPARMLSLADDVGLETLAELWRDADAGSLPGALWAVYLLRTWCRTDPEQILRLWRAGHAYAPADEVVAGMAGTGDPQAVTALADAVLSGAYRGDFAVALERAASVFRVMAAGRQAIAADDPSGDDARRLAAGNERAAEGLALAARRWRAGELG